MPANNPTQPEQSVAEQLKDILKEAIACNQYLAGDTSYMKDSALDEYITQLKALLLDAQRTELKYLQSEYEQQHIDYIDLWLIDRIADLTNQKNQVKDNSK